MKRAEGTCKDCWARWCIDHDAWVSLHWSDYDAPEPKLPQRPAPWPGPRCTTCHRAKNKANKLKAHGRRTEANFGIPAELYWALYEFQGGRCAILNCRATGKTRRLAVDHDHKCCPGRTSCGKCVRGLLCHPHNEQFGRNGDNPAVLRDMADYLELSTMDRYVIFLNSQASLMTSETIMAPRLERGPQGEQLDGNTGAGSVQQQL